MADALGRLLPASPTTIGPYAAGRVGDTCSPVSLAEFADAVAGALPPTAGGIRVGNATRRKGPVGGGHGGSGDDQFDAVRASGADVYVTADLRHHPVLEAREEAAAGRPTSSTPVMGDRVAVAGERRARLVRPSWEDPSHRLGSSRISSIRAEPWDLRCCSELPHVDADPSGGVSKADPSRQWRLLDLQAIDTRLDQIAHARANPPQVAAIDAARSELAAVDTELVNARRRRRRPA